jgi:hypothetical protein
VTNCSEAHKQPEKWNGLIRGVEGCAGICRPTGIAMTATFRLDVGGIIRSTAATICGAAASFGRARRERHWASGRRNHDLPLRSPRSHSFERVFDVRHTHCQLQPMIALFLERRAIEFRSVLRRQRCPAEPAERFAASTQGIPQCWQSYWAFPYHGGTGKSESGRLYRITRAK